MPQGALQVYGTEKLARLGRDLRVIGGPTARGIRSNMRRAIIAETKPLRSDVQAAYRAVQVPDTSGSTGLRDALAKSTKMQILASSRTAVVRLSVNHPLAAAWEGLKTWRHPLFGNRNHWYTESPHPTFYPTVRPKVARIRVAVVAAIRRTTDQLPKEL